MRAQARPRSHPLIAALAAIAAASLATGAAAGATPGPTLEAQLLGRPLVALPLQDLAGLPEMAGAVEQAARAALAERHALVDPSRARDALRRLRIRDSGSIPPPLLERLAGDLGTRAFLSLTLLQGGSGAPPRVALSARLTIAGRPDLAWAGFSSASGLDEVRLLGLGRVDDPLQLAREAARRLIDDLEKPAPPRSARPAPGVFRSEALAPGRLGIVAVIPFDTLSDAPAATETATDAALAALYRHGTRVAAPGAVEEILRQRGVLLRGEIDDETRAALRAGAEAETLFTGTVESFRDLERPSAVEPEVGLSARLLDASTGRILWTAGIERRGWDREGWFQRRRVYAIGSLTAEVLESLIVSFEGSATARIGRDPS
jgi:hypothetical protein